MSKTRGMLTLEQLEGMVAQGEIETVLAGFTDHYGRLMGKRFDAEMFVDEVAKHGGHACDYLLTVDMEMEPVPGYSFANWELGYGDVHMVPDFGTLRLASWLEKTAFVLCDVKSDKTQDYVEVAPRSVLRRQIAAARKMGYAGH
ncbi:MAG TPA: glutamine synthetase, partial [Burkholderiales bacterium]|nr:glutamine synthetase [Burkholderiales bacterium]